MSDKVVSLADYRRKKEANLQQALTDANGVEAMLRQNEDDFRRHYDEYVEMMKMFVRNELKVKMDELYVECIAEEEALFRDKNDQLIDHTSMYEANSPADDYESMDLIINGLLNLAPKRIILVNSNLLHPQLLYTIVEIFGDRVELEML